MAGYQDGKVGVLSDRIGLIIQARREGAGLRQIDLAEAANVSQTCISYWESGKRLPSLDDLELLAQVFNVPLSSFLDAECEDCLDVQPPGFSCLTCGKGNPASTSQA